MILFLIKNKSGNNEVDKNREKVGNGITTRDRQLSHLKLSDHVYFLLLFLQQAIKLFVVPTKKALSTNK